MAVCSVPGEYFVSIQDVRMVCLSTNVKSLVSTVH
jgi:hypothetical protein